MDGSVWGAGCRAELSVIGNFRTSAGAMLGASPAHQESVIDPGQGIDGVEVGHEKGRRLRISRGNESRRGERTEWAARARITKLSNRPTWLNRSNEEASAGWLRIS